MRILIYSPCDDFCVMTYDVLEMKNVEGTDIKEMKKKKMKNVKRTNIKATPLFQTDKALLLILIVLVQCCWRH